MSSDDTGTSGVKRFEIFNGVGKRRDWPSEVKASIVAMCYSGRESVSAMARRHSISVSQFFTWHRLKAKQMEERGIALPVASRKTPAIRAGNDWTCNGFVPVAYGTVSNFVCGRAVEHYAAMALMNRSPNRTANWALAMDHSRGCILHSFSERFKIR